MKQVLFLEINEVIFPFIEKYIAKGHLPTFARLFREYGYSRTSSEQAFSHIEPWIQWVSVHTGKQLDEHGVFRLGDIVGRNYRQIWEHLEARGLRVGAIFPMNAENRLRNPCFFMPDPWTETSGSGSWLFLNLYSAIKQAVNRNAENRLSPSAFFFLLLGGLRFHRIGSVPTYLRALGHAFMRRKWAKAIFLDRFLADIFLKLCANRRPDYASVFLNAAAHIQHHFLYNSEVYDGAHKNPAWYMAPHLDPLLEAYKVYDQIIAETLAMPGAPRVMIATALQQEAHGKPTFFYRFKDHEAFFRNLGFEFVSINPLMSRDFVMKFRAPEQASEAEQWLREAQADNGKKLFTVDNRGDNLFVELIYPDEIQKGMSVRIRGKAVEDFDQHVAFVAIRNGQHNATGYFLDTGMRVAEEKAEFPITKIWNTIESAFDAR